MKQTISALVLIFLINVASPAMANPSSNSADSSREYHHPITVFNDSNNYIALQFGRLPDEQMVAISVNPRASGIYYSGLVHRKLRVFLYFKVANSASLLFKSDFKYYNTELIQSIRITSPEKGYVVTCLDGGTESCVVN